MSAKEHTNPAIVGLDTQRDSNPVGTPSAFVLQCLCLNLPLPLHAEDILGTIKDDPNRVVTRLFLTTKQYSKVIGKGGMFNRMPWFVHASLCYSTF